MSPAKHQLEKFRLRGFLPNDGADTQVVFGDGPVPLNADGTPMVKLWDQDHEHHIIITDHVDT